MLRNFAQIVEEVKQRSFAEKEELREILNKFLIEERRREILENCEGGLEEYREGKLTFSSDIEKMYEGSLV